MMDCNWERFYENKAENDFYDEEWKENFFGSNTFFTKLGPYGNCHIFSSMVSQLNSKTICYMYKTCTNNRFQLKFNLREVKASKEPQRGLMRMLNT